MFDRHRKARRREAIASAVVVTRAEVDRQAHAQRLDDGAMPFVVAPQPADDRGEEHVVEAAFGRLGGPPQVVEADVQHREAASEAALAHQGRHRRGCGREQPADGADGLVHVRRGAARIAHRGERRRGHAARDAPRDPEHAPARVGQGVADEGDRTERCRARARPGVLRRDRAPARVRGRRARPATPCRRPRR